MTELEKYKKAFALFVTWTIESGFGYFELGELFNKYEGEIERKNIGYSAGMMYIALREVENRSETPCIVEKAVEEIEGKL